ncbi:MAG: alpha/beta fold hydrolase [Pseudoxanthomonas sp.]
MAAARVAEGKLSALLVHGAGGGAWEWQAWAAVLHAHGVAAHAIDLQAARAGPACTCLQDYALQLHAELERLPRPRVLIGASLGGLLSLLCAEAADALVLVNPLPPSPWHKALRHREWADTVPWQRHARLASTRDAMADADEASALFAFRHWRDESGQVMREAQAGIASPRPDCPALFVISARDEEVAPAIIFDWANAWGADKLESLATSHVGPLLGRNASGDAAQAVAWLNRLGL